MSTYIECGYCSGYHLEGYEGDCRNDEERWTYGEVMDAAGESPRVNIVFLEGRVEETGPAEEVEQLKRQVAILGDACKRGCEWLEAAEMKTIMNKSFAVGCAIGYLSTGLLRAEGAGYKVTKADGKENGK